MTLEHFRLFLSQSYMACGYIGENILELSETKFMNLSPYVFDEDYVAKSDLGYL